MLPSARLGVVLPTWGLVGISHPSAGLVLSQHRHSPVPGQICTGHSPSVHIISIHIISYLTKSTGVMVGSSQGAQRQGGDWPALTAAIDAQGSTKSSLASWISEHTHVRLGLERLATRGPYHLFHALGSWYFCGIFIVQNSCLSSSHYICAPLISQRPSRQRYHY